MMKIRTLTLQNFRGIENVSLPLQSGLTVIAAVNGGEKKLRLMHWPQGSLSKS